MVRKGLLNVGSVACLMVFLISGSGLIGQEGPTEVGKAGKLAAAGDATTSVTATNEGSTQAQGKDWPYSYTGKSTVKTSALLPDKDVKAGDSWDVAGEAATAFGAAFKETEKDKLACSIKCTLEEVKDGKTAKVKLEVKMSVTYKGKAGGPGGKKERIIAATLPGHFLFDMSGGKVTELSLSKSDIPVEEQYSNQYIGPISSPGTGSIKVELDASKPAEPPKSQEKKEEKKEGPAEK